MRRGAFDHFFGRILGERDNKYQVLLQKQSGVVRTKHHYDAPDPLWSRGAFAPDLHILIRFWIAITVERRYVHVIMVTFRMLRIIQNTLNTEWLCKFTTIFLIFMFMRVSIFSRTHVYLRPCFRDVGMLEHTFGNIGHDRCLATIITDVPVDRCLAAIMTDVPDDRCIAVCLARRRRSTPDPSVWYGGRSSQHDVFVKQGTLLFRPSCG